MRKGTYVDKYVDEKKTVLDTAYICEVIEIRWVFSYIKIVLRCSAEMRRDQEANALMSDNNNANKLH
jgi:hypothetical protein